MYEVEVNLPGSKNQQIHKQDCKVYKVDMEIDLPTSVCRKFSHTSFYLRLSRKEFEHWSVNLFIPVVD